MKIDVTGVDLVKLTQAAYDLSSPAGLGFLHYTPEPLTDEEAQKIVENQAGNKWVALSLDYIKGRAVKLRVRKEEDKLMIDGDWFDHSPSQLTELLAKVGITCP